MDHKFHARGGECDFLPLHLPFQGMKANEEDITHALQG